MKEKNEDIFYKFPENTYSHCSQACSAGGPSSPALGWKGALLMAARAEERARRAFKPTGERLLHPPAFLLQKNKWQK